MVELIINRLRQDGDVEDNISPRFIVRNWSPAFTEWSTKAVRDAFFASLLFPRLLNGDAVKDAIARGVRDSNLASFFTPHLVSTFNLTHFLMPFHLASAQTPPQKL